MKFSYITNFQISKICVNDIYYIYISDSTSKNHSALIICFYHNLNTECHAFI